MTPSPKLPDPDARQAIVVGAGIVGICTALALQDKGFKVSVIDRDGAAEDASHGNAGVISPWSCVPQSLPGIWRQVPKWLLDPEGPLAALAAGEALNMDMAAYRLDRFDG